MKPLAVYEGDTIRRVTGSILRPGGFFLTDRAMEFLDIREPLKGLDLGCGMGATVNYLEKNWGLKLEGVDSSQPLLRQAKEIYNLDLREASAEKLPYEDRSFDFVLMECSLSLMEDYRTVLLEASRVLKVDGFIFISDVYARDTSQLEALKEVNIKTCLRGLFDLEVLSEALADAGFESLRLEDWSSLLRQLMVDIIFTYGSMDSFWTRTGCVDSQGFKDKLKKCKPGYFFLVGQRGG